MSKEAEASKKEKAARPIGENVVLVGNKPTMNYVLATVIQFNQGADKVIVKARGRAISKAVDTAQIVQLRFLQDQVEVKDVKIGTERVGEYGQERNVSTIEILLARK
ncbi:MAG: DNA-binding protein Alba [Thermoprotei archaeon]|nr:MAG: DNA-binding protein Alba [Thermoprotei archaeon]RLF18007.1 MAG: DNA-binding protein Alba [Thermoprotei archaeon]